MFFKLTLETLFNIECQLYLLILLYTRRMSQTDRFPNRHHWILSRLTKAISAAIIFFAKSVRLRLTNNQFGILIFNKIRWFLDMKYYSRCTFFYVSCSSRQGGPMALVSYISFELLSKVCLIIIHPNPVPAKHLHKIIRYVSHWLPLAFNMTCVFQILQENCPFHSNLFAAPILWSSYSQ